MNFFNERQKFNQIWIWVLLLSSTAFAQTIISVDAYQQLIQGKPFGNQPMSDMGYLFFYLVGSGMLFGAVALVYSMTLETKIDRNGFHYKFFPFIWSWKTLRKEDLTHWAVVESNPLTDFGGWGYRFNWKGATAMNIRGSNGIRIGTNGKKFLFGTQKPIELKKAMDKLMNPYQEE